MPPRTPRMLNPLPAVSTSSIEAALAAAWDVHGQESVDAAEKSAGDVSERVERLSAELATSNRVVELRALLIERHEALHRHHYLSAFANDEPPDPLPQTPDVAGELVMHYARAHPNAFTRLTGQADAAAVAADAKAAGCGARMEMIRQEYLAGVLDLAAFTASYAREWGESQAQREQASRLRAAAETARSRLRADIGEALGSLPDLKTAMREVLALGKPNDPVLAQLTAEHEIVDADLARLGLDDDQVEPGPIAATLQAQRDDLAVRIQSRKREAIGQTGATAGELVDRARGGDAAALAQIVGIVRSKPLAFPPELDSAILETMGEALAASPAVFAELIALS
jgi:hypothetical protein